MIGRTTIGNKKENSRDTQMAIIVYPVSRGMMQS